MSCSVWLHLDGPFYSECWLFYLHHFAHTKKSVASKTLFQYKDNLHLNLAPMKTFLQIV